MSSAVFRKDDGSYALSKQGELNTYALTMQKLVLHYLTKGMNQPQDVALQKAQELKNHLSVNFQTMDDYLDKLPEVANILGESNSARFGGFVGKNFIQTLEGIQKQYFETEVVKLKNKLENPYRVPSDELVDRYGEVFTQAKPLRWPLPLVSSSTQSFDSTHAPTGSTDTSAEVPTAENIAPPSERLLKAWENDFAQAPPLTWPLPIKKPIVDEESADAPVVTISEEEAQKMPSERLLEELEELFAKSPPLSFAPQQGSAHANDAGQSSAGEPVEMALPVQVTLRQYIQLQNGIRKFMASKDNAGYQSWLTQLSDVQRSNCQIFLLHNRHSKGQAVDWSTELDKVAQKNSIVAKVCEKIYDEIVQYQQLLPEIQKNIQWLKSKSPDQAMAQNLYSQLVNLFENKDTMQNKQTQLKMALLQVGDPTLKTPLQNSLIKLLDKAKEIYQLD